MLGNHWKNKQNLRWSGWYIQICTSPSKRLNTLRATSPSLHSSHHTLPNAQIPHKSYHTIQFIQLISQNSSHSIQLTQLKSLNASHSNHTPHLIQINSHKSTHTTHFTQLNSFNSTHTTHLTQLISHNSTHSTHLTQLNSFISFNSSHSAHLTQRCFRVAGAAFGAPGASRSFFSSASASSSFNP